MIGLLGDSIDEALIQGIAAVAMGTGDLGSKTVTLTENNTYTYDPQDEVPPLDGYNAVSVTVAVPIDTLTVTQNGTYTHPNNGGYSPVYVNVPDSGYTFPDDTEYTDILPIVGTDDVTDKTTNVTIGFSVEFLGWTSQETRILPMDTVITGSQGTMGEDGMATGPFANINGQKIAIGNLYDAVQLAGGVVCRNIVIDSTTGTVSGDVYRFPNEGGSEYYMKSFSYQNNDIIGYGDSSHTFSVKNKE